MGILQYPQRGSARISLTKRSSWPTSVSRRFRRHQVVYSEKNNFRFFDMTSRRASRTHGRVQTFRVQSRKHVGSRLTGIVKSSRHANSRAQKKSVILSSARAARQAVASDPPALVILLSAGSASDSDLSSVVQSLTSVPGHSAVCPFETFIVRRDNVDQRTALLVALDLGKIADVVLLVFKGIDDKLSNISIDILTAMREQGLPSFYSVAIGDGATDQTLRKLRGRWLAAESLGSDHVLRPIHVACGAESDDAEINKMARRRIFSKRPRPVSWRSRYGYMLIESACVEKVEEQGDVFVICGWVRGQGFSANDLVHLTGFGTFAAHKITELSSGRALSIRDNSVAAPVESEADVDDVMAEQTWPPEVNDNETKECRVERLAEKYDAKVGAADDDLGAIDDDGNALLDEVTGDLDDEMCDINEHKVAQEASQTAALFPDEVDTPVDQPARNRFARYRGLKSLRTGEWDPKEQLPPQYAALFQFRNLSATKKRVLKEAGKIAERAASGEEMNFVCHGKKVKIELLSVPIAVQQEIRLLLGASKPVIASGMLRHENRRSVVHFGLQRVDRPDAPEDIKAKTHLEMHCGFVRFDGRPMFSEHNANSDKHKMERFLRHGRYTVASFYGPAVFSPAPALLFHPGGSLIATGTALGADPDRIMLKRIILTGYPFKTQKRRAVVKFMFFNPDDIRWFKPVELWTKMGRSGHILEPVGTHGHMKCIFDNVILHHDTVCMTLYKRVFPKLVNQEDQHRQSM